MADTLVDSILSTGPESEQGSGTEPGVMINLVITDETLYAAGAEPGWVDGYGPVPADLAREMATSEQAWLRRLYTAPTTGELVAMDSRARIFPGKLAQFLRLRDQRCRTPWCDAPIRHADHVEAADDRRPHHRDQRPRPLRGLQLQQTSHRLARQTQTRPRPRSRHHHPDRPHLQLHRTSHQRTIEPCRLG